jgi:dihydroorotate dehydrogenase (fumarate)
LEEAGAGAAVMQSLFEEQIEHEEMEWFHVHENTSDRYAESTTFFPEMEDYNTGPDRYLQHIEQAKRALTMPIIGSLNGTTKGGWIRYAKLIEQAGADALELNVYIVPTEAHVTSEQIEQRYLELVAAVRAEISLPLAVKIGPFFTSLPHFAKQIEAAGANGLVLFNRFLDPDIDLATLEVTPHLVLSSRDEIRLPLRWIGILRNRVKVSLACTSGVHFAEDALKALLAGADVAMMASALLRNGPTHLETVLAEVQNWLVENEYKSVTQLIGSVSREKSANPEAFERSNYMRALASYTSRLDG